MFDVCVVGGGMIGSTVALGLAKQGLSVAIIERKMPIAFESTQAPDMRVSAISQASENLLKGLGAWQYIARMRACPYRRLAVWEEVQSRTEFNAADIHTTHLGHIVENRLIQLGLHQAITHHSNVTWFTDVSISQINQNQPAQIVLVDGTSIDAQLVVAADGANSWVRQSIGIGTQGWQYQQQALGISIKTHASQQDITWQQFSPTGPMAFLPLYDNFASLVWYNSAQSIDQFKQLNYSTLKQLLVEHFPSELVDFDILQVAAFELTRMHANQYYKDNVVLVGDAAHTINPLAGQGVNLGFKDVSALLTLFDQNNAIDWRTKLPQMLSDYERKRRRENLLMMTTMDALYGVFSNTNPVLSKLRNAGLKIANNAGVLKHHVMKYAMGV